MKQEWWKTTSYQVNTKLIKSCKLKELGFGSSPAWETACLITCSESRASGASAWVKAKIPWKCFGWRSVKKPGLQNVIFQKI